MAVSVSTLQVSVKPNNPGDVTVNVACKSIPGPDLNETFTATTANPMSQLWHLDPALYAVTITWKSGYQLIDGSIQGNGIVINGVPDVLQSRGLQSDQNGISATFGVDLQQK